MPKVAKLPQFHRIKKIKLPRFFTRHIQSLGQFNAIYKHATGYKWEIKILGIMATKKVSGLSSKAIQHPAKIEQQLALVSAVKAFCPKPARPLPFGDHTGRDTHNLPKLGVNTRPLINLGRRFLLLSESRRLLGPQGLKILIQVFKRRLRRHGFHIDKQNSLSCNTVQHKVKIQK